MKLARLPWMGVLGAAAVVGSAALASEGCTVTTTNGPLPDSGITDDGGGQPDTGAPNPCNSCLASLCSAQGAVCDQNTECNAIYVCATAAGCDQNCVTNCFSAHPNGQADYCALASCDLYGECSTCQATCGTPASSCQGGMNACQSTPPVDAGAPDTGVQDAATVDSTPQDCNGCVMTSCAAQQTACGAGTDCEAYTQCLQGCTDSTCTANCDSAHAQGKSDAANLAQCTVTNCSGPCGL